MSARLDPRFRSGCRLLYPLYSFTNLIVSMSGTQSGSCANAVKVHCWHGRELALGSYASTCANHCRRYALALLLRNTQASLWFAKPVVRNSIPRVAAVPF